MMNILQSIGVDWRDQRMISEPYINQEAVVRIAGGVSDSGIIGRGVRQECPLSPLLFSIYAEMMMKEALEKVEEGIRVSGKIIKDVKYADDQGMIANTPILCNTFTIFSQFTLSNAFSKCTKQIYMLFPNSRFLSHIILMTPITSLVPQPFLDPN